MKPIQLICQHPVVLADGRCGICNLAEWEAKAFRDKSPLLAFSLSFDSTREEFSEHLSIIAEHL